MGSNDFGIRQEEFLNFDEYLGPYFNSQMYTKLPWM